MFFVRPDRFTLRLLACLTLAASAAGWAGAAPIESAMAESGAEAPAGEVPRDGSFDLGRAARAGVPCIEPSALDLSPGAPPLRVEKAGATQVRVSWEWNPGEEHAVYGGTLLGLWDTFSYDHDDIGACDITTGDALVDVFAGDAYYLAVMIHCLDWESSYGRTSLSEEREWAWTSCP